MDKKTLGKGLRSLIPEEIDQVKDYESIEKIDIEKIVARKEQPRKNFEEESLNDLKDSIKEYGLLNPIVLTKVGDRYEILAGERRYRASKLLGVKKIDAIIRDYSKKDVEILSLVENVQREDLSKVEEARAYKKLSDEFSMTQEEIAKTMGKSRSYIANILRLLKLEDDEIKALEDNKISSSQARSLLAIEDLGDRKKTLDDFINKRINVRDAEKISRSSKLQLISNKKKPSSKALKKTRKEEELTDLDRILLEDFEQKLRDKIGSKVKIDKKGETYKLEIFCYNLDDVENLYRRLSDENN